MTSSESEFAVLETKPLENNSFEETNHEALVRAVGSARVQTVCATAKLEPKR